MNGIQKLKPLVVPWQVSPSTPFLRLLASEGYDEEPTQITFQAHFGLRARTVKQEVGFLTVDRESNPNEPHQGNKAATDGLVRIRFGDALHIQMSPSFSDREILDPAEFDHSLVPYSTPPIDVGVWLRDFQSLWIKMELCPDPRIYTVESSRWLERLKLSGFQHFVVKGHDSYIEVLARDWKWTEIKALPTRW